MRGSVKWFDSQKGYGFLTPDGGGPDVFVHKTAIQAAGLRALDEGQIVEFETKQNAKGLCAANVVIVSA